MELDFNLIERRAYCEGDYERAELAALASESEDAQSKLADLEYKFETIRDLIVEANWKTGKKAELRELVESIADEL